MLKKRVIRIMGQVFGAPVERINEDSSPETIENWDSLKQMNLILSLEEEFGTRFTDDEIVEMLSTRAVLQVLEKKGFA